VGSKSDKTPVIFIVGETASGKTAASIKIAQKIGGEIICADSRTVYKQMDIGTAKPSLAEQKLVPHHLVDVVFPNEKFSAAEFKRRAEKCIQEISSRGNVPIVVGGTGLYIDALLYNFQFKDKPNDAYRTQLLQMNDEKLTTILHKKNIDTSSLNTKNRRHVIRAIERSGEVPRDTIMRKNAVIFGLKLEREILQRRIESRVDQMFADGFLEEVAELVAQYGWNLESMSGIGYRVARMFLEGEATVEDVKKAFIARDLSLAKRQRTWFKRNKAIRWFDDQDKLASAAFEFIETFNYNEK
jgi:tRNA dimethylallyltransferase